MVFSHRQHASTVLQLFLVSPSVEHVELSRRSPMPCPDLIIREAIAMIQYATEISGEPREVWLHVQKCKKTVIFSRDLRSLDRCQINVMYALSERRQYAPPIIAKRYIESEFSDPSGGGCSSA